MCPACPVQERCPSATGITKNQKKKMLREAMVKAEREEAFGEVEIHRVHHIKTEAEVDDEEVVRKEKQEAGEVKVKNEVMEGKASQYFSQDAASVKVKEEEESEMVSSAVINGSTASLLKDTSQLERDSADIEDLIP
jgi:isopentenyldiphosphate isomerase